MTGRRAVCCWARGGARLPVALAALVCGGLAVLAANFPPLTGRIVDQANIIAPATRSAIEPKLADLESKSGIQLVVATVSSLEGDEIEPYANKLFRAWKLGEKTKNNGVLLLVAPKERRVRIEVGYGLEGTLTDALTKIIIANAIAPRFKAGDFNGGVSRGVDDIITVLTTDASEWQKRPSLRVDREQTPDLGVWLLLGAFFIFAAALFMSSSLRAFFFALLAGQALSGGRHGGFYGGGGFSGGGSFDGGGFSDGGGVSRGGGSSGGGGASGGWGGRAWRERGVGGDALCGGRQLNPPRRPAGPPRGRWRAPAALACGGVHRYVGPAY